ncbi:sensor histidine kinase, partial [Parasphingorhabdus sp.]
MTDSRSLAEPVRAELDADGLLVSADPPLMRLHRQSGGVDGGPLAVPQLADLCRLSKRLGMNLSRSVTAANEDSIVSMWVETQIGRDKNYGRLAIAITEWRESEAPVVDADSVQRQRDFDRLNGRGSIRTDASLRIMSIFLPGEPGIAADTVGRLFWDSFELLGRTTSSSMSELIAERQPIRSQKVRHVAGSRATYMITGQPLIDGSGLYSGYQFTLEREVAAVSDPASIPSSSTSSSPAKTGSGLIGDSLFGSQLGPALRQPLDKIIANAETISNQLVGPLRGNYSDYANDIAAAGRHLLSLVDDLSDLEAIERSNFSVASDDIDLVDLAHRTAGLLAVKSADHQIRIDLPSEDKT